MSVRVVVFASVVFFAALIVVPAVANPDEEEHARVPLSPLTPDSFDKTLEPHTLSLVLFTRPDCPLCLALEKQLEIASAHFEVDPVPIFKIETHRTNELAVRYGIGEFPAMKMFRKSTEVQRPYRGGYSGREIAAYLRSQQVSPSHELASLEEAQAVVPTATGGFQTDGKIIVFGFFKRPDMDIEVFKEVADNLRDAGFYSFVHSFKDDVMTFYGHRSTFVVYNPNRKTVNAWPSGKPLDPHFATEFIANNDGLPYVGQYKSATEAVYLRCAQPVFRLYVAHHTETVEGHPPHHAAMLVDLAKRNPKMIFTWARIEEYDSFVYEQLDYTPVDVKNHVAIAVFEGGQKYRPAATLQSFDLAAIERYVTDYFAKPEPPYLKSQPVPTSSDTDVVTLVGHNFRTFAYSDKSALFVLMYAPWCGHSKAMLPAWEALAQHAQQRTKAGNPYSTAFGVDIAMIDVTANEIPPAYAVSKYPTMYFALPGAKMTPIEYQDQRTLEAFDAFISKQVELHEAREAAKAEKPREEL